jgi:hypothetical protein
LIAFFLFLLTLACQKVSGFNVTDSNPEKDSKVEESPVIQSTVAKDTLTSEPDQKSLDDDSEKLKAYGTLQDALSL